MKTTMKMQAQNSETHRQSAFNAGQLPLTAAITAKTAGLPGRRPTNRRGRAEFAPGRRAVLKAAFAALVREVLAPTNSRIAPRALLGLVAFGLMAGRLDAAPAAPAEAVVATNASNPKIQFDSAIFDFGKTQGGAPVKHTFIFTNTGDTTLVLANVQPSCGCTTAGEWSRQVEPGKTGAIPVQFNSGNFNGPVTKTVTVTSNDKTRPSVALQIKGTIWKPIEVTPQVAMLNVPPGAQSNATAIVRIVNNLDEPITLSAPESNNRAFAAQVTTTKPGREFQLTISAMPPFEAGKNQAQISLKTSSTNTPVLTVTAWARVQPPLAANPPPSPDSAVNHLPASTTSTTTASANASEARQVDAEAGQSWPKWRGWPQGFLAGIETHPFSPKMFSIFSRNLLPRFF